MTESLKTADQQREQAIKSTSMTLDWYSKYKESTLISAKSLNPSRLVNKMKERL